MVTTTTTTYRSKFSLFTDICLIVLALALLIVKVYQFHRLYGVHNDNNSKNSKVTAYHSNNNNLFQQQYCINLNLKAAVSSISKYFPIDDDNDIEFHLSKYRTLLNYKLGAYDINIYSDWLENEVSFQSLVQLLTNMLNFLLTFDSTTTILSELIECEDVSINHLVVQQVVSSSTLSIVNHHHHQNIQKQKSEIIYYLAVLKDFVLRYITHIQKLYESKTTNEINIIFKNISTRSIGAQLLARLLLLLNQFTTSHGDLFQQPDWEHVGYSVHEVEQISYAIIQLFTIEPIDVGSSNENENKIEMLHFGGPLVLAGCFLGKTGEEKTIIQYHYKMLTTIAKLPIQLLAGAIGAHKDGSFIWQTKGVNDVVTQFNTLKLFIGENLDWWYSMDEANFNKSCSPIERMKKLKSLICHPTISPTLLGNAVESNINSQLGIQVMPFSKFLRYFEHHTYFSVQAIPFSSSIIRYANHNNNNDAGEILSLLMKYQKHKLITDDNKKEELTWGLNLTTTSSSTKSPLISSNNIVKVKSEISWVLKYAQFGVLFQDYHVYSSYEQPNKSQLEIKNDNYSSVNEKNTDRLYSVRELMVVDEQNKTITNTIELLIYDEEDISVSKGLILTYVPINKGTEIVLTTTDSTINSSSVPQQQSYRHCFNTVINLNASSSSSSSSNSETVDGYILRAETYRIPIAKLPNYNDTPNGTSLLFHLNADIVLSIIPGYVTVLDNMIPKICTHSTMLEFELPTIAPPIHIKLRDSSNESVVVGSNKTTTSSLIPPTFVFDSYHMNQYVALSK